MRPIYFMLALCCFLFVVACKPPVTVPKDWCVKYALSWSAERNIPDMTLCVCTPDLYPGLDASLKQLMTFPDGIEIGGIVRPADCEKDKPKPAAVNDGDEEVKSLLRN